MNYYYTLKPPIEIEEYGIEIIGYCAKKINNDWKDYLIIKKDESEREVEITYGCSNPKYLTPQEHELIGSTVEERYAEKSNIPLAIQDDEKEIRACQEWRKQKLAIHVLPDNYKKSIEFKYNRVEIYPVIVILSPLNDEGEVTTNPIPVNLDAVKDDVKPNN